MDAVYMYHRMQDLKQIFDIVRLVDPDKMEICNLDEQGNITREQYKCFIVWKKQERCMNCISAKACTVKGRLEKFEFIDNDIYHVISKCITIDHVEYALELVTKTNDETLFEAYGKSRFVEAISQMNEKMYMDVLTGLKNRRYYNEQKNRLIKAQALALLDIDHFKQINDNYGHSFGDRVLKDTSDKISKVVRKSDTVIRYGGDEILILFWKMEPGKLKDRLEIIRECVHSITYPDKPDLQISISIGGYWKGSTNEDAFEKVDQKLYLSKQKKNCVEV